MLTNRYLEYSEDITKEVFSKIFYIISQYGYKPLVDKDTLLFKNLWKHLL